MPALTQRHKKADSGEIGSEAGIGISRSGPPVCIDEKELPDHPRVKPPIITSVSPRQGSSTGGATLTIRGQNFQNRSRIRLGDLECLEPILRDSRTLECVAPASSEAGAMNVQVANDDGGCGYFGKAFTYIPVVVLQPRTKSTVVGFSVQFAPKGGKAPFQYSIVSGEGRVNPTTGEFVAPAVPGTSVVRVIDAEGGVSDSVVSVNAPLGVQLEPQDPQQPKRFRFTVVGGAPPISYSIEEKEQGRSADGNAVASAVLRVRDQLGNTEEVQLNVNRQVPLSAFATSQTVVPGEKMTIVAAGGKPPYAFSMVQGLGKIHPSTGVYEAPREASAEAQEMVRVADATGMTQDTVIQLQVRKAQASRALSLGFAHTCALLDGGVRCWGDNKHGELGIGTLTGSLVPKAVRGLEKDVISLASGHNHSCALLLGGIVKCWGDNRFGQLGDDSTVNALTPVEVFGMTGGVRAIAAGQYHTCAILRGGALRCWGSNRRGQLGNGSTEMSRVPIQVKGLAQGVLQVALGAAHSCALLENGSLKCWGYNSNGQLGDGTLVDRLAPFDVKGLQAGVSSVTLGGYHTCATLSDRAYCWGNNGMGQAGLGTVSPNVLLPTEVKGLQAGLRGLVAGTYHTCAHLEGDRAVACWGYDREGQLGDGKSPVAQQSLPVPVQSLGREVDAVALGSGHSCALVPSGVRCWGRNDLGQFGDQTVESSSVPIRAVTF